MIFRADKRIYTFFKIENKRLVQNLILNHKKRDKSFDLSLKLKKYYLYFPGCSTIQ